MSTIVRCPSCKEEYDICEDSYIQDDGRCWKCHITDHMLKGFKKGIEIDGVKMCGKEIKKDES